MSDPLDVRLERLAAMSVPAAPTVDQLRAWGRGRDRRKAHRGLAAAAIVLVGALVGGAAALRGDRGSEVVVASDLNPGLWTTAPGPLGSTVVVIDEKGEQRGTLDLAAVAARDERVLARLVEGFREPQGSSDQEYDRLWEALATLDPVSVLDGGQVVGYWTGSFLSAEQLAEARAEAAATVEELMGD